MVELYVHSHICLDGIVLKLIKHRDGFTFFFFYTVNLCTKFNVPVSSESLLPSYQTRNVEFPWLSCCRNITVMMGDYFLMVDYPTTFQDPALTVVGVNLSYKFLQALC
jgi:hypothetical protein